MKRFYTDVAVRAQDGGWQVALDGRLLKSQGGRAQIVPAAALAEALAAEWAAQGDTIDPAGFVLRDLADFAIDVAGPERAEVIATLLGFAETDTLCYRAEPDEPLFARQQALWEPLLAAAETRWNVHFTRISGIIHRPQPTPTLERLRAGLDGFDGFALSALNTATALAASLVIGLAALEPDASPAALWEAANLEEDWQAQQWGKDFEAEARRERRFTAFAAAIEFARLARG